MAKDYYQILSVPKEANQEDIKKAYRSLAMQFHPDRNPGKEQWANEKFKEINEAFSVLGDPEKRKQYDQFGAVGNAQDIFGSQYTREPFEDVMRQYQGEGLGFDFLDSVFGDLLRGRNFSFRVYRSAPGGGQRINLEELLRQQQQQTPLRPPGEPVRYEITVNGEQAARGMQKDLLRNGKRLRVRIPSGIKDGMQVRLGNARQLTDGVPGDILITVKEK